MHNYNGHKPQSSSATFVVLCFSVVWAAYSVGVVTRFLQFQVPSTDPRRLQLEEMFKKQSTRNERSRSEKPRGFIVYSPLMMGQGTGNIMQGLLSAHLLANESNRTVCINPIYWEFLQAFEPIHPQAVDYCQTVLDSFNVTKARKTPNHFSLVNFGADPNECKLKERLLSNETVLHIEANTYPRWAPVENQNMFFKYYRARKELLNILPYHTPPRTVVHLRFPDNPKDKREAVDDKSLHALFQGLTKEDSYVVCNHVKWYKLLDQIGIKHSPWKKVGHSVHRRGRAGERLDDSHVANLEMWADWYTILTAEKVLHTHSDFSSSAVHWQNLKSKKIMGNDGNISFLDESWRIEPQWPKLTDRNHTLTTSKNLTEDPYGLANCRRERKKRTAQMHALMGKLALSKKD